ncbi:ubiquinone biosynthesis O-methyltransferase, mitochondrial-like isoform X1 [Panicum miliaceum]|uniref:Ubiquinone biosynthesis O-methyltransferase, mitochondrial n=1 Tax=Panicum miliaceum TaxID=4540 RepID=A0A3L6TKA3_PANMI|nr:ubiquinone biosynthesis O-methyltransferase, mitochondrial-like isoform X1 [Panicum miliaceum]
MLRRVPPSLRRALLSSASTHYGGAQIPNPSHSPSQTLLPQWRRHASVASSSAPPQSPPPPSSPRGPSRSGGGGPTVSSPNPAEVAKFAAIAETWWDANGPFKPLHLMNPTRLSFIRSTLCRHFRRDPYSSKPLEGLKVIDVGCGGGILSEPLARMGATVTAIDAVNKNIKIASIHAASDPTTASIEYCCTTAEALVKEKRLFDAVISLEVIEHVANPLEFCESLSALTVPNGATVVSTINRSMRAYATAIVAAEYILRWLPRGTHEWSKLVTPEEVSLMLQKAAVSVEEMAGFVYNPLSGEWSLSDDISVNYIAFGVKKSETPSTNCT